MARWLPVTAGAVLSRKVNKEAPQQKDGWMNEWMHDECLDERMTGWIDEVVQGRVVDYIDGGRSNGEMMGRKVNDCLVGWIDDRYTDGWRMDGCKIKR